MKSRSEIVEAENAGNDSELWYTLLVAGTAIGVPVCLFTAVVAISHPDLAAAVVKAGAAAIGIHY